jgi:asparagine synthase (glutamine-hydrolysing)
MCGIAGAQVNAGSKTSAAVLRMLPLLRHRGPDDQGNAVIGAWHIGNTRLSIVDLHNGHQPFVSRNGQWSVVFNGEIYNHGALRDSLCKSGTYFKTTSDTEVLVELIGQYGFIHTLELIEGMFSIAAVDTCNNQLWLARDRFGEKPLFIDRRNSQFKFCSELSPLLLTGSTRPRISGNGLMSILRLGFPWPGSTAIQGIDELRPGQWLRRTVQGHEDSGTYWRPPDEVDTEAGPIERCQRKFLDLLFQSVRQRLVADVPIGIFVSGGIDSAAVSFAACVARPGLSAVTLYFAQEKYDERALARKTAGFLGLQLHEESGDSLRYSTEFIDDLLLRYGQPFGDSSAIPTRALSRAARNHFRVALSGDGGDEIFCGYLSFRRQYQLNRWGFGRVGGFLSGHALQLIPGFSRLESLRRALELNSAIRKGLFGYTFDGVFDDEQIFTLVEGTDWERPSREHLLANRAQAAANWNRIKDPLLALSLHLISTSLPQDMLMKTDRMSMAESLEVRAPFLDSQLASYVLSLPAHLKMKGIIGKVLLRECLRGNIPAQVLSAPKRGFELPLRQWLGERFIYDLRWELNEYASDPEAELNTVALKRLVDEDEKHCRHPESYRSMHRLLLIYIFLRWRRLWCRSWTAPLAH